MLGDPEQYHDKAQHKTAAAESVPWTIGTKRGPDFVVWIRARPQAQEAAARYLARQCYVGTEGIVLHGYTNDIPVFRVAANGAGNGKSGTIKGALPLLKYMTEKRKLQDGSLIRVASDLERRMLGWAAKGRAFGVRDSEAYEVKK